MDTPTAIAAVGIWVAVFFGALQSYLAYMQLDKKNREYATMLTSDFVSE